MRSLSGFFTIRAEQKDVWVNLNRVQAFQFFARNTVLFHLCYKQTIFLLKPWANDKFVDQSFFYYKHQIDKYRKNIFTIWTSLAEIYPSVRLWCNRVIRCCVWSVNNFQVPRIRIWHLTVLCDIEIINPWLQESLQITELLMWPISLKISP